MLFGYSTCSYSRSSLPGGRVTAFIPRTHRSLLSVCHGLLSPAATRRTDRCVFPPRRLFSLAVARCRRRAVLELGLDGQAADAGKEERQVHQVAAHWQTHHQGIQVRHFAIRCVIWLRHSGITPLLPHPPLDSPPRTSSSHSLPHASVRAFLDRRGSNDESFDLQVTAEVSGLPEPPVGIVIGKGKFGSNTGVSWYINQAWSGSGGSYKLDFKLTAIEKIAPRGGSGTILEVLQAVDKGVVSEYYTSVLTKSTRKSGGLVGGGFVKGFPNILPMFSC
ncbi:unnamed protein product [Closterium sp. NIES-54]